jgi:hypothetical protein
MMSPWRMPYEKVVGFGVDSGRKARLVKLLGTIELLGPQLAVPREDRVGCDDAVRVEQTEHLLVSYPSTIPGGGGSPALTPEVDSSSS